MIKAMALLSTIASILIDYMDHHSKLSISLNARIFFHIELCVFDEYMDIQAKKYANAWCIPG